MLAHAIERGGNPSGGAKEERIGYPIDDDVGIGRERCVIGILPIAVGRVRHIRVADRPAGHGCFSAMFQETAHSTAASAASGL